MTCDLLTLPLNAIEPVLSPSTVPWNIEPAAGLMVALTPACAGEYVLTKRYASPLATAGSVTVKDGPAKFSGYVVPEALAGTTKVAAMAVASGIAPVTMLVLVCSESARTNVCAADAVAEIVDAPPSTSWFAALGTLTA